MSLVKTCVEMKHYEVVAAVIVHNKKILAVQKGESKFSYISYKYEFPGGKIEQNETEVQALTREIKEELSIVISVKEKLITVDHQYPDFNITLHSFMCECEDPLKIDLSEHISLRWLSTFELGQLNWADADMPIVKALQSR